MLGDGRCHSSASLTKHPDDPDLDIWCSANELIKQCGDQADIEAAARADEYEAKGDRDGQRLWLRILKAIDALRTAGAGETRH
jgi:hypothetical protein